MSVIRRNIKQWSVAFAEKPSFALLKKALREFRRVGAYPFKLSYEYDASRNATFYRITGISVNKLHRSAYRIRRESKKQWKQYGNTFIWSK